MNRRGPSHLGPYGLACQNCFKAKSKCVARPGVTAGACARCHRLSKECQPSDSIRHRGAGQKKASDARIAELESKVNSLLSKLDSRDTTDAPGVSGTKDGADSQAVAGTQAAAPAPMVASIDVEDDPHVGDFTEISASQRNIGSSDSAATAEPISMTPDERLSRPFDIFRFKMLPEFPFIHLPADMTPEVLRSLWPTLLLSIMCVSVASPCCSSESLEFKLLMSQALVALDKKPTNLQRMDKFLAILVYLAWGADYFCCRGTMSRLILQAVSLACDMTQNEHSEMEQKKMLLPTVNLFHPDERPDLCASTTKDFFLDRRRAILGCYVLSSVVSAYFGRMSAMQWTMQMEESLVAIGLSKDCPSDAGFVTQVRLQVLQEKGLEIYRRHETDYQNTMTEAMISSEILSFVSLKSQLQELRESLSPRIPNHELLQAQAHSVELTLNQLIHTVTSSTPVMIRQFDRMLGAAPVARLAHHDQAVALWNCLQSSSSCISKFLELPEDGFCHMSFVQWYQITHSAACIDYLTRKIDDAAWDREAIRTHIEPAQLFDKLCEKIKASAEVSGYTARETSALLVADKIRDMHWKLTNNDEQQHIARQEATAAWTRSVVHGGGGGANPNTIEKLAESEQNKWNFDYVLG